MTPLDLSLHPPRSPRVQLGDLCMLARTIDRARGSLPGGNLGDYDTVESGLSSIMLGALHITADEFVAAVKNAQSDDDVLAWVNERTDPATRHAVNARMNAARLADLSPERRAHIDAHYPPHIVDRCETGFELLDDDDREAFAGRA